MGLIESPELALEFGLVCAHYNASLGALSGSAPSLIRVRRLVLSWPLRRPSPTPRSESSPAAYGSSCSVTAEWLSESFRGSRDRKEGR